MANRKTYQGICVLAGLLLLLGSCTGSSTGTNSPTEPPLTPTETITSTPTPTANPTLPTEDAYALLEDYLQNNGGCELPCWWGIAPGVSTLQDAQNIFAPLSGIAYRDKISLDGGYIEFDYQQADNIHLFLDVRLIPRLGENIVDVISIQAMALKEVEDGYEEVQESAAFAEMFNRYTLQTILQTYGLPAQLSIYVSNNPFEWSSPDYFSVFMLYPESGIFLSYTSSAGIGDGKAYSRPTESFISMSLVSPNRIDSYEQVLSSADSTWEAYFSSPEYYKSTEEALGMTEQEFYETILQTPDYLFESPLSLWPPFP